MCINASGNELMCRYDRERSEEVSKRVGYRGLVIIGCKYNGYCYVEPEDFKDNEGFNYWVELCSDFNELAKPSTKK